MLDCFDPIDYRFIHELQATAVYHCLSEKIVFTMMLILDPKSAQKREYGLDIQAENGGYVGGLVGKTSFKATFDHRYISYEMNSKDVGIKPEHKDYIHIDTLQLPINGKLEIQ